MPEKYQILRMRLSGQDRYILWYSDARDGVYVYKTDGVIPVFENTTRISKFSLDKGIVIDSDEIIYCNLDLIRGWLDNPTEYGIKYDDFFHVLNILHDIVLSIEELAKIEEEYPGYYSLYDKIFWGAMMESGGRLSGGYQQEWDEDEVESLRGIFNKGIDYFRRYSIMAKRG